jgi:AmmeMemoRadiSam system protein A
MTLSDQDKCLLIRLARHQITEHLMQHEDKRDPMDKIPATLEVHCGAFVSLYVKNKLRGCIGTFSEQQPLHTNVREMALSAATSDSRFLPINSEELDGLKIEISVLSPRRPVTGPEEIILGKHGIYMEQGTNRGTLLPQVAVNQQWDVEQFLGNCAKYKAGLGWDGWRKALLYTFEAIVFNSEETGPGC